MLSRYFSRLQRGSIVAIALVVMAWPVSAVSITGGTLGSVRMGDGGEQIPGPVTVLAPRYVVVTNVGSVQGGGTWAQSSFSREDHRFRGRPALKGATVIRMQIKSGANSGYMVFAGLESEGPMVLFAEGKLNGDGEGSLSWAVPVELSDHLDRINLFVVTKD